MYDVLPSHCTLMHRFWSELDSSQLANKLQTIFETTKAIPLFYGEREVFGPPPVTVNKIRETSEVKILHNRLYEKLNDLGVEYTAPQWVGDGYKAHITERPGIKFTVGDHHTCNAIYLIEVKVPGNEEARYVRAKFVLGSD